MTSRYFYQGYNFVDLTTLIDTGRYRSRVAVVAATDVTAPSQHFLDFEVFSNHAEAQRRAFLGARAWIDGRSREEEPAFPARLAPL
jgi:hypothetical protein